MQKTESRVSELVRWNAKKGGRYVQALSLDLTKEVENRVGKVYGIMTVDAPARIGEALFAHVEDAFGRGVLEALQKGGIDASHEQIFESAIGHVNHAVSRAFGEHGFGIEPEYVSAALLSLREHDVVAAVWGQPSILLFHSSPGRPPKVLDLVDESAAEPPTFRTAPVRRCFGSVISGRIGTRDRLLLATQDLRDLLGPEELESYATAEDHATATALIREKLSPVKDDVSIAALVLDVAPVRYVEDSPTQQPMNTQSSLAGLRMMESRTHEVLTASPIAAIQKKVAVAASAATERLQSLAKHRDDGAARNEKPSGKKTPTDSIEPSAAVSVQEVDVLGQELVAGASPKEKEPILVSAAYAGKDAARATGQAISTAAQTMLTRTGRERAATTVISRFNELSGRSRYLLFGALFLVSSLNASVLVGSWQRQREDAVAVEEHRYAAIEQKIDSAEASIIYKDEDHARDLLGQATAAIAELPEKKPEDAAKKDSLKKRVAESLDQLRHVVQLSPPDVVANLTTSGGPAAITKIAQDRTNSDVIWSASSAGDIFRISTSDGAAQKAGTIPGGAPTVFIASQAGLVAASASGEAAFVSPAGKATIRSIVMDPQGGTIDDAEVYNGRLYVLDAAHNRILRHDAASGGFAKPQFYLKDGTDVSGAVSLAIDGALYVLKKDGSILRVSKGLQEPFAVAKADPPITAAKRIRVQADDDDLYVLDGSPSRILRFSKKTGTLAGQYVSPALDGATDFTIDTKTRTAIVSVKNQLLRFALPQ